MVGPDPGNNLKGPAAPELEGHGRAIITPYRRFRPGGGAGFAPRGRARGYPVGPTLCRGMPMRLTLRRRMLLMIVLPTLVIYVVVLGLTISVLMEENRAEVREEMTRLARSDAARFDASLRRAMGIAETTAAFMTSRPEITPEQIYSQLERNVQQLPFIYGAAMAFEPGTIDAPTRLFSPYVHRGRTGELVRMNIDESVYDWYADERWEWFRAPKESGQPVWTPPYFDEGAGNVLMVTYSVPFFESGAFRGVTTVDIAIPDLNETVGREIVGDRRFYVLSPDGRFIYSSDPTQIGTSIFDEASRREDASLMECARAVTSGEAGVHTMAGGSERGESDRWVFHAPIASTGWAFASEVSEREALADVRRRMTIAGGALTGTLLLIVGAVWFVSGRITRPVARMRETVNRIAAGDLDATVDGAEGEDELGDLARAFNKMACDLRSMIDRLTQEGMRRRDAVIFSMARLTESRDDDTGKHLERICRYTRVLAEELRGEFDEIDDEWIESVTTTAALHDIGKVGVPDAVLKKAGRLTEEERKIIQQHTTLGGDALLDLWRRYGDDTFIETATQIALGHHERWDGTGYPYQLAGEDIALAARIVALADVYDALTSERVYKPAMPHEEAVRIIREGAGTHFDPRVVEGFLRVAPEFERIGAELRA